MNSVDESVGSLLHYAVILNSIENSANEENKQNEQNSSKVRRRDAVACVSKHKRSSFALGQRRRDEYLRNNGQDAFLHLHSSH